MDAHFQSGLDIECTLASQLRLYQHHAIYTPLRQPTLLAPTHPIPICRLIYTNPESRLLQRPLDGRKIHHHVTPVTDQHGIIHHGVPKFPASISSMSREGPMLIEMTRLSTDTLGISISLQIKVYLPPAAEIGDMYDSLAWALTTPI